MLPGGGRDTDATAEWTDSEFKDRHGAGLGQKSKVKYYGTEDGRASALPNDRETMVRSRNIARTNGNKAALNNARR